MTQQQAKDWFRSRGWKPFDFQREVWQHIAEGRSGLLHSPTGTGKTLAVWLGLLMARTEKRRRILWVTPMRALATDTAQALAAVEPAGVREIALRTGDVSATARSRQLARCPDVLVTTPESLSILLSHSRAEALVTGLIGVVVDEWHELLGTKRGVQVELALARLRARNPGLLVWGLSATLANTAEAALVLAGDQTRIVSGSLSKETCIETIFPAPGIHFPWAGHLGLTLAPQVAQELDKGGTALVFTNTRSQAELWHAELASLLPRNPPALHHASIDRILREAAEEGLRSGSISAVVATSSLDLGVDFAPVDKVFQIGSPRGVARLLQRAGRSGHGPGRQSRIFCVPTNTFELMEIAAARDLVASGRIEARQPLLCPVDVLAQHILTVASAGEFDPVELLAEVRTTHAFGSLSDEVWSWTLDFAARGGPALRAYPDFHRLVDKGNGRLGFRGDSQAKRHRLTIGTIASDSAVEVRLINGKRLGEVEEAFISKLKPGDAFHFAGHRLVLVRLRAMRADVRTGRAGKGTVPQWMGGKMPLSSELAFGVRQRLAAAGKGKLSVREMERLRDIFAVQREISTIPDSDELLLESVTTREGYHLFLFPFEGRTVHEGLGALIAWRLGRRQPSTFTFAVNDYGIEWLSNSPVDTRAFLDPDSVLAPGGLEDDIVNCMNAAEMSKRQFRQIARVAGLTFEGFPGSKKSTRHMQLSSGLLFDVFQKYDPANLLLRQAEREVLETQLAASRLAEALDSLRNRRLIVREPGTIGPLAYPLFVDRLRAQLTTEEIAARLERLNLPYAHD
ncbi:MAG: ligase-associated DNA damage response DEXH box helicase [Terrimicrobiaceae bacterium]